jgi:hypothetical protein
VEPCWYLSVKVGFRFVDEALDALLRAAVVAV